jgi:hypothetical protein
MSKPDYLKYDGRRPEPPYETEQDRADATPSELPGLPEEPVGRMFSIAKGYPGDLLAALDEWQAYARALRSRLVEQGEEIERLSGLLEKKIDAAGDRVMAMTDEQIAAALRLEGRDPEDVSKIGKLITEKVLLQHDLERAESALREARETEREMCIKKCDEIWAAENMSKHVSQSACQAARSAISKCMMAIRSMT